MFPHLHFQKVHQYQEGKIKTKTKKNSIKVFKRIQKYFFSYLYV